MTSFTNDLQFPLWIDIIKSAVLPTIFSVIITYLIFQFREKKDIIKEIQLELKSLARHFNANINVLEKCLKQKQLMKIDFDKLLADEIFLGTINLENIHTLRLNEQILLDLLQAQLVVRNTDLVVKDIIDKLFKSKSSTFVNDGVIKEIKGLLSRYRNLTDRSIYLGYKVSKKVKLKSSAKESVWDMDMDEIQNQLSYLEK